MNDKELELLAAMLAFVEKVKSHITTPHFPCNFRYCSKAKVDSKIGLKITQSDISKNQLIQA